MSQNRPYLWYNLRMDKKTILTALVTLAVGVAIGYFVAPAQKPNNTLSNKEQRPRAKANVANAGEQASLDALRRRIRELERRLADATVSATPITNAVSSGENRPAAGGFGPPSPGEWRARMEEMKINDPARYAQMTNRMAQWRSRSIANTQDKLDFFASLDTSAMTPRQRENHEKLQNLLVRREELMQSMDINNADISDADREKAFREMHELRGQIHSLENAERDMLLNQAARNLGCRGSEARELVDTIKTIYQATQSWGGGRRGPGRGGPPPGGPR